jgi:hypothetical protein
MSELIIINVIEDNLENLKIPEKKEEELELRLNLDEIPGKNEEEDKFEKKDELKENYEREQEKQKNKFENYSLDEKESFLAKIDELTSLKQNELMKKKNNFYNLAKTNKYLTLFQPTFCEYHQCQINNFNSLSNYLQKLIDSKTLSENNHKDALNELSKLTKELQLLQNETTFKNI